MCCAQTLIFLCFSAILINCLNATLIVQSFEFKYNQKYALVRPKLNQINNSTVEFQSQAVYYEDIVKMIVRMNFLTTSKTKLSRWYLKISVDIKSGRKTGGNSIDYNNQLFKLSINKCNSRSSSGTFVHQFLSELFSKNNATNQCPIKKVDVWKKN